MLGWLRGSGARKAVGIGALVVVAVATRSQSGRAQATRMTPADRRFADSVVRQEGLPSGMTPQLLARARSQGLVTASGLRRGVSEAAAWQRAGSDLALAYTAAVHRGLSVLDEVHGQAQLPEAYRAALVSTLADPFFDAVMRSTDTTVDGFRAVVRRVAGADSLRLSPPRVSPPARRPAAGVVPSGRGVRPPAPGALFYR